MTKQLNILDLGGESVTFKLKNKYLNHIKNRMIHKGGFSKLEKCYNIDYTIIWQAVKRNSIPLYILNAIKNYLNLKNLEKNIEAYKSYSGKTWVKNPKLIIKESPELLGILGHSLGDGYITLSKACTSTYTNTSEELINNFKRLCKNVFGEVELTTYLDKRCNAQTIILPKVISLILVKFFPELLDKKIPQDIFNLPKEKIVPLIRAFADDESCVTTSAIYYVQKDKVLLEDIRKLHLLICFKEENLTQIKRRNNLYNFSVIGRGLIYFYENVGYKHLDKMKDLEVEVKRKTNKRRIKNVDTTKKEITSFLNTPKTIKELSAIIGVQPNRIRKHIKRLEKEDYVRIIAYKKYNVPLWIKIKDYQLIRDRVKYKIMEILKNDRLSIIDLSKKTGLKVKTLFHYLNELRKEKKIDYRLRGNAFIWYLK